MTKRKEPFNPFYAALLVIGIAFTVTACAYAVMIVRATKVTSSDEGGEGLMALLDARGMEIMGIEVLLLGVATAGAIGLDQCRGRRETGSASSMHVPQSGVGLRSRAERGNEEGR